MMLVFVFVYKINLILCDRCDDECGSSVFSVLFKEEDKQKIQSKIDERTRVICRARSERKTESSDFSVSKSIQARTCAKKFGARYFLA
jgi:hypothetical protein